MVQHALLGVLHNLREGEGKRSTTSTKRLAIREHGCCKVLSLAEESYCLVEQPRYHLTSILIQPMSWTPVLPSSTKPYKDLLQLFVRHWRTQTSATRSYMQPEPKGSRKKKAGKTEPLTVWLCSSSFYRRCSFLPLPLFFCLPLPTITLTLKKPLWDIRKTTS